eukprot:1156043-Pelagomonas_calceolata.AAC.4
MQGCVVRHRPAGYFDLLGNLKCAVHNTSRPQQKRGHLTPPTAPSNPLDRPLTLPLPRCAREG